MNTQTPELRGLKRMKDGGLKYWNVRIEETPTESFPTMVRLVKGPAKLKSVVGKKYINLTSAILAIDEASVEAMVNKEKWQAVKEHNFSGVRAFDEI
jgi:hypothetical protein